MRCKPSLAGCCSQKIRPVGVQDSNPTRSDGLGLRDPGGARLVLMPLMRWFRPKARRDSTSNVNTTHSFPYDDGEYHAEFETTPFSAGASRDAYRGKLVAHAKRGRHHGAGVVIKVFKAECAARSECWAPDLRAHTIAASLARRFNREVPSSHPLHFVMPIVVRIDRATDLMAADNGMMQSGKSDPYVEVSVGNQVRYA